MKKLSLLILSLILALSVVLPLSACGNNGEKPIGETAGLQYTFDDQLGGYALTSLNGTSATEIGIPSKYEGSPVVKVASGVFTSDYAVTKVQLPASIKVVEDGAFDSCSTLQNITVLSGNENYSAKSGVLYNAQGTEFVCVPKAIKGEVVLPDTIKAIPDSQFENRQSITKVVLPEGLETIGDYAFYMCLNLTKADWPSSIKKVGFAAFYCCKKLKAMFIPGTIEYIGGYAFEGCDVVELTYDGTEEQWYEMLEVAFVDSGLTTQAQEKMYWIRWTAYAPIFLKKA